MKLKLKTDFFDFYDMEFDSSGETFYRIVCDGVPRKQALQRLEESGYLVPRHGVVSALAKQLDAEWGMLGSASKMALRRWAYLVVYTDDTMHAGEGKIAMASGMAQTLYPDCYATEYLPSSGQGSVSLRYLQIGDRRWWLSYQSSNDWRSNRGDVRIGLLSEEEAGWHPTIKLPMFAIDFVPSNNKLYAIDFNTAPVLRFTGLENLLKPSEVVGLIKKGVEKHGLGR